MDNIVFQDGRKYSAVDNFVFQDGRKYSAVFPLGEARHAAAFRVEAPQDADQGMSHR